RTLTSATFATTGVVNRVTCYFLRRPFATSAASSWCRMETEEPNMRNHSGHSALDVIRKTPGVLGGDACVGDRRIAVWMLVHARQLGVSDEQLRNDFEPPLAQTELDAAWDYYEKHRDEIDQAIRDNEEA